eukprot:7647249-Alexandrium_andersonii.AAC.1
MERVPGPWATCCRVMGTSGSPASTATRHGPWLFRRPAAALVRADGVAEERAGGAGAQRAVAEEARGRHPAACGN